jgi:hypothetical protein
MSGTSINCSIERVDLPDKSGRMIPSTRLTCGSCNHVVECFGQRGRSVRRALVLLRNGCPSGMTNSYAIKK